MPDTVDLLAYGTNIIGSADTSGGGGSGGHVIEKTNGDDMPQEDNLQFVGVYTVDDSENDRTKVNIVRQMTKAQMTALSSAEKEGFIRTTDEPDNPYQSVDASQVHYGNSDVETKLNALTTDVSGKVSKSGDTMTGALSVTSSSTATPLSLKGSSANTTYLSLLNSSGTELGKIGANGGHPIWQYGGTNVNIATWSDLFMNRATPFYIQGNSKDQLKFTFTGLSASGSIHLIIFALTCSGEILAACSSSGFSSIKKTLLTDGDYYHLGMSYSLNNGYTFKVNVGTWSSVWGIFIHTDYPNAAMTMEWTTLGD